MPADSAPQRKFAILFRYGAAEHLDFFPALPALIQGLNRKGWEVHHYGFKGKRTFPVDESTHLQIHAGPFRVRRGKARDKWIKTLFWLLYLPFLGQKLKKQGIERVFVDETLPLSGFLLRLGYKGWTAFTLHDFFTDVYLMPHPVLHPTARWIHSIDRMSRRKMDHLFPRVEAARSALVEQGVSASHITCIPDAVDLTLFHPSINGDRRQALRKKWGFSEHDLVMVHHGILHPNKGNALLVHALFRLRHRFPNLKLLLIGDGPERLEVERTCHTRGIPDRVVCTGWLPDLTEVAALLQMSDIGLVMRKGVPGDDFHVTSTLVHNLACGLPTMAVRLKGISEVMTNTGAGFLFDPDCRDEFDHHLSQLAKFPCMRLRMGSHARALAERQFQPEPIADKYLRALIR